MSAGVVRKSIPISSEKTSPPLPVAITFYVQSFPKFFFVIFRYVGALGMVSYAGWTGRVSSTSFLPRLGRVVSRRPCFLLCWHDSIPTMSSIMPVTTTVTAINVGRSMLVQSGCRRVVLRGDLDELISLLNRVTRSLARTPRVVVLLLLSADMENCRTPLFLLVAALSPM